MVGRLGIHNANVCPTWAISKVCRSLALIISLLRTQESIVKGLEGLYLISACCVCFILPLNRRRACPIELGVARTTLDHGASANHDAG